MALGNREGIILIENIGTRKDVLYKGTFEEV